MTTTLEPVAPVKVLDLCVICQAAEATERRAVCSRRFAEEADWPAWEYP